MAFIKDLYHDEIRDGYLVKADMKKVWNRQLEMWQEVDRICRKHNITYWAAYGTLLGAARHGGFVPWDDDFDLCMTRPEYDRFCNFVDDEINNSVFEIKHKTFSVTKITHSLTTVLESNYGAENNSPQGVTIDIFAMDISFDGTENSLLAFKAMQEIMTAVSDISKLYSMTHVQKDGQLVMEIEELKRIAALPFAEKLKELYRYTYALSDQSATIELYEDTLQEFYDHDFQEERIQNKFFQKDWFRETVYLPFETTELPVPVDYEKILTAYYGDWCTPVNDGKHKLGFIYSPDIPWREFFKLVDVQKLIDDFNRQHNKQ